MADRAFSELSSEGATWLVPITARARWGCGPLTGKHVFDDRRRLQFFDLWGLVIAGAGCSVPRVSAITTSQCCGIVLRGSVCHPFVETGLVDVLPAAVLTPEHGLCQEERIMAYEALSFGSRDGLAVRSVYADNGIRTCDRCRS